MNQCRDDLKIVILGRRRPGTTLPEHRRHIRQVHGERVLNYIATDPTHAPRGYIQHQVFDGCYSNGPLGSDPLALQRDFVTQVFFEDVAALRRSRETDFYRKELQEDEEQFVDQAAVLMLITRPEVLQDGPAKSTGACKLIVLHRLPPQVPRAVAGRLPGLCRHVRNHVLPGPAGAPPVTAVDEYWLHDEDAARAALHLLREEGALPPEHSAALLAWEEKLA